MSLNPHHIKVGDQVTWTGSLFGNWGPSGTYRTVKAVNETAGSFFTEDGSEWSLTSLHWEVGNDLARAQRYVDALKALEQNGAHVERLKADLAAAESQTAILRAKVEDTKAAL